MVITPDAPHGLFNRSVVLIEHEHLTVTLLPGAPVSIEIDGRVLAHAESGARLEIRPRVTQP